MTTWGRRRSPWNLEMFFGTKSYRSWYLLCKTGSILFGRKRSRHARWSPLCKQHGAWRSKQGTYGGCTLVALRIRRSSSFGFLFGLPISAKTCVCDSRRYPQFSRPQLNQGATWALSFGVAQIRYLMCCICQLSQREGNGLAKGGFRKFRRSSSFAEKLQCAMQFSKHAEILHYWISWTTQVPSKPCFSPRWVW